jgi:sterol desaturase/sphingolipid hydroxylase (fatty acid hydroxylase superfamily)
LDCCDWENSAVNLIFNASSALPYRRAGESKKRSMKRQFALPTSRQIDLNSNERANMRLSKTAYYADFGIYAVIAVITIIWGITRLNSSVRPSVLAAFVLGGAVWTLVEYVLHRFIFHGASPIAPFHARHHAEPDAYIGTPTWLSASVILGCIFLPTWLIFSLPIAACFSTGFVLAFFWYGIAHHLIHHRAPRLLALVLKEAARRHYRHHRSLRLGNFGLTTDFWDRVYGTRLVARTAGARGADGFVETATIDTKKHEAPNATYSQPCFECSALAQSNRPGPGAPRRGCCNSIL